MTEVQQTNIAVANFIIGEPHKERPFDLILDAGETGALFSIAESSHHLHSGLVDWIKKTTHSRVKNGTGIIIRIQDHFVDHLYHMLSTYIAEHEQPKNSIDQFIASGEFDKAFRDVFGLPKSVVMSLKEVS